MRDMMETLLFYSQIKSFLGKDGWFGL